MEKQPSGPEQPKFVPKPAESFEVDFLNVQGIEIHHAMSRIGGFVFRSSGPESEGKVYFKGERGDGTKITITIEKGKDYKSPAEIAAEIAEEEKEKTDN